MKKKKEKLPSHKHSDDAGKKCGNSSEGLQLCLFFYYLLIVGNPKLRHSPQAVVRYAVVCFGSFKKQRSFPMIN